jgi:hypothetical protein
MTRCATRSRSIQVLSFRVIGFLLQCIHFTTTSGYQIPKPRPQQMRCNRQYIPLLLGRNHRTILFLSTDDWSSFQAMDDDDVIVFGKVLDKQEYALENDSQDEKEAVGSLRPAPVIERNADPISIPAGKKYRKIVLISRSYLKLKSWFVL